MTRIAIAGPGAVAGVIAWHLAKADAALTVVARPATAGALNRDGLTLVRGPADERTTRVAAVSDPGALGPQEVVLVGFKAHDWPAGLALVRPLIGPETILVPMLNGIPWWFFQGFGGAHEGRVVRAVDPDGILAAAIPASALLGCAVYVAGEREKPTRIRWNGRKRLVLGEPFGVPSERLRSLAALLRSAGIDVDESPDIRHAVWAKLLGNVTYNPLSVAAHARMGRMGRHPPLQRIVRTIMEEAVAVAQALGVAGPFDIEQRLVMAPEMDEVKTSMLQDYEAGRELELDAIVNAVVELGQLVGVATPMIEAIGALAAERAARGRDVQPG